ncbi:MAG: zinc-binding dehydrogenase, partial [Myxococcota bacterium]
KARVAAFLGVGKPFDLREYDVPDPAPGEALLRVERANVCGSDLHMWRGDLDLASIGVVWPVVMGHEFVGRVEKLGTGRTADSAGAALAEGDRVAFPYFLGCGRCRACGRGAPNACPMALAHMLRPCEFAPHFVGGFADRYLVADRQPLFRVPDGVDAALAAGANCALAQVLFGLHRANLRMGETVAIQGAGGLGIYATCVAREMGAGKIIVLDGVPARLDLARACGADEVVDIREYADPRARSARVQALTDGWGADVVCELVGTPAAIPEGLRMLAPEGRYLEIGNISPKQKFECDPAWLVMRSITIVACVLYPPWALRAALEFLDRARARYPLDRIASQTYPLAEIDHAFRAGDALRGSDAGVVRASIVP